MPKLNIFPNFLSGTSATSPKHGTHRSCGRTVANRVIRCITSSFCLSELLERHSSSLDSVSSGTTGPGCIDRNIRKYTGGDIRRGTGLNGKKRRAPQPPIEQQANAPHKLPKENNGLPENQDIEKLASLLKQKLQDRQTSLANRSNKLSEKKYALLKSQMEHANNQWEHLKRGVLTIGDLQGKSPEKYTIDDLTSPHCQKPQHRQINKKKRKAPQPPVGTGVDERCTEFS